MFYFIFRLKYNKQPTTTFNMIIAIIKEQQQIHKYKFYLLKKDKWKGFIFIYSFFSNSKLEIL